MRILLAGGGTAGSIMPLLSIHTAIKKKEPDAVFLFVGTRRGEPEKTILANYDIPFTAVTGGKLRRYFDLRNISDLFLTVAGFFQSLLVVWRFKPDIILGAGGFIAVPVIWAGWVLQKKILIHQQDIRPSLANILTMNLANQITVTFEKSLRNFPASKTVWTGNPARQNVYDGSRTRADAVFHLQPRVPLVLVAGGGTGAQSLNTIVNQALPELVKVCQIIHLTGPGKRVTGLPNDRYHQYEFLGEEMKDALAAADLIISRAGLSSLTEYALLAKPVILVPLPNSHQEENAGYFSEKGAAMLIRQDDLTPGRLVSRITSLLNDRAALALLSDTIKKMIKPNAAEVIAQYIFNLVVV